MVIVDILNSFKSDEEVKPIKWLINHLVNKHGDIFQKVEFLDCKKIWRFIDAFWQRNFFEKNKICSKFLQKKKSKNLHFLLFSYSSFPFPTATILWLSKDHAISITWLPTIISFFITPECDSQTIHKPQSSKKTPKFLNPREKIFWNLSWPFFSGIKPGLLDNF